jgi:hypothetical protein
MFIELGSRGLCAKQMQELEEDTTIAKMQEMVRGVNMSPLRRKIFGVI